MKRPIVTLLTDFGLTDHYVGTMKGVILGICPEAHLIDISHQVPAYSILEGAWTLSQSWRYFPAGTVHVAVVDPGVGSARRAVVAAAGGHLFVAPDNGILSMVFGNQPAFEVHEITESQYFLHPVSRTFHGRDIFSPVAAHLANQVRPEAFGPLIPNPVILERLVPVAHGDHSWIGTILHVDTFGNLVTSFDQANFGEYFEKPFALELGGRTISETRLNYCGHGSGELFVVIGSGGFVEVSAAQGNAAQHLGIRAGAQALFTPRPRA